MQSFLYGQATPSSKPKAFVNWILFNEQFEFVANGSGADPVGNNLEFKTHVLSGIPITKNGYLYIYVSNETPNIDVFFDNLQVTHTRGPLVEESHYYPAGLEIAALSSKAALGLQNKYKYQGQEMETALGLMAYEFEARQYDPQLGRWHVPDPAEQFANPYLAMGNNWTNVVDPDGRFSKIAFMAGAFIADFVSSLGSGNASVKQSWANVNNAVNDVESMLTFNLFSGRNAGASITISPFSMGISLNTFVRSGNFTFSRSAGIGVAGPFGGGEFNFNDGRTDISLYAGAGTNHVGYGASFQHDGWGAGYYRTHYGSAIGPDGKPNKQIVGGAQLFFNHNSVRLENDFLDGVKGDADKWRSNAVEVQIGNFVVGTRLYNNDPDGEGQKGENNQPNLMGKYNSGTKYKAWESGKVYEAPLWIGYRYGKNVDRIGFSHKMVHDRTQNWVHRNGFFWLPFGHQNYYLDYSQFQKGLFYYSGFYNQFSLWGR